MWRIIKSPWFPIVVYIWYFYIENNCLKYGCIISGFIKRSSPNDKKTDWKYTFTLWDICPLWNGISIYFLSFLGAFIYLALICVSGEIIYNVWWNMWSNSIENTIVFMPMHLVIRHGWHFFVCLFHGWYFFHTESLFEINIYFCVCTLNVGLWGFKLLFLWFLDWTWREWLWVLLVGLDCEIIRLFLQVVGHINCEILAGAFNCEP